MAICLKNTTTINNSKIELYGNEHHNNTLIIGVFHGDEPQGKDLIDMYISNYPNTKLLMIPCLNPDGMQKKQRTNASNVDLNRNFPTKNWQLSEHNEYYGGKSPASEPETTFLIDVVEEYKPKRILTLHAPYKIVNYDGNAIELAKKVSEITGYPIEENIGYPTPGSFGTWAGLEKNIPTITLELDDNAKISELKKPVFDIFKLLENY